MVPRQGDPHRPRRHDQPRGGGGARHGQALRRGGPGISTCDEGRKALFAVGERTVREGDWITLDGALGRVFAGQAALVAAGDVSQSSPG